MENAARRNHLDIAKLLVKHGLRAFAGTVGEAKEYKHEEFYNYLKPIEDKYWEICI